ncbi:MAG: TIGR02646 family protein [Lentisphaeria bacterium]
MRTICKGNEPSCLTKHRQQPHSDYDNYTNEIDANTGKKIPNTGKDALRQALVMEQRGLCCYCQSRIHPNEDKMKIEHWQSQTGFPHRQLDYSNLLGACLGGIGRPKKDQHCDTRKGDSVLCFSVSDPAHPIERQIKFLGDGSIASGGAAINSALNDVLNLNSPRLVSNRKAVLDAFKQRLGRGNLNAAQELRKWDGSQAGDLPEFAQVMVFWLEKRIVRQAP